MLDIIDQSIDLRELYSSCKDLNLQHGTKINTYDDLLFCNCQWEKGASLWNPWLRQINLIKLSVDKAFVIFGLGYDSSGPQKFHKILIYIGYLDQTFAIYECASQASRFIDTHNNNMPIAGTWPHVSLYGNLYWISYNCQTSEYFIRSFDFTREIFKPFCLLPCQDNHSRDEHVHLLAVYKGDRFSLLKQSFLTSKIEIWVMKNKIDDKEEVLGLKLMTLTTSNLPMLFDKIYGVSYFIYDKSLFICCENYGSREPHIT